MIRQDKAQRGISWAQPPDFHKGKLRPKRSSPCLESDSQDKVEPGFKHRSVGEPGQRLGTELILHFLPWTPTSQAPNLPIKIRRLPGEGSTQSKGQNTRRRESGTARGRVAWEEGTARTEAWKHGCLKDSKEGNPKVC